MTHNLVTIKQIKEAWETIKDQVHRTPMSHSTFFSNETGCNIYLKEELFQKTGSFKVRGVSNKMNSLTAEEKAKGVIGFSAGNHAQAVAWSASQYGISSTICMPKTSSPSKQTATREYGGEVLLAEGALFDLVLKVQAERDLYLVHPFDDPLIIAGHGTIGLEIVEDLPDVDVVIIGVGGGGLISGVAAAVKQLKPNVKVYGAEPLAAPGMTRALENGSPVTLTSTTTIADGLAAPFAGVHNLAHVQAFVDDIALVSEDEIRHALRLIWDRTKLMIEPAAAAPMAALLTGKIKVPAGSNVCVIMCGGNVNLDNVRDLLL
ncbi:MAG: threonine dehydratase [Cellvibrionaceae bacterium]|jgi:threonine dehydratase